MITRESRKRDLARLLVWYPLRWLLLALPWPEASLCLFRLMGQVHFRVSPGRRREIRDCLLRSDLDPGLCHDPRVVIGYLQNHYVNSLLIMIAPRFTRSSIERVHRFKGLDRLEGLLSRGRGAVLVHPHMGPAQLPWIHLGLLGIRSIQVGALAAPGNLSRVGSGITAIRERSQAKLDAQLVAPDRFLRPLFRTLQANGVAFVPGDGAGFGRSYGRCVEVPFMGQTLRVPTGAASLASKTGAWLVPVFTGLERGLYVSEIHDPIEPGPGRHEGYRTEAWAFSRLFEDSLRRHPELWLLWDEFKPGMLLSPREESSSCG